MVRATYKLGRRRKTRGRRTRAMRGGALRALKTATLGAAALGILPGPPQPHGFRPVAQKINNIHNFGAFPPYSGAVGPVAGFQGPTATTANGVAAPINWSVQNGVTVADPETETFLNGQGQLATWAQSQKYLNKWINAVANAQASPKPPKPAGANVDLCEGEASICAGHLDIPRSLMPQIYEDKLDSFRAFASAHDGIDSHATTANVTQLKPVQHEISEQTTNKIVAAMNKPGYKSWPLIVSNDGYIIDGHHRWSAWLKRQPDVPIEVIVMDAPAIDVLKSAAAWHAPVTAFGVKKAGE